MQNKLIKKEEFIGLNKEHCVASDLVKENRMMVCADYTFWCAGGLNLLAPPLQLQSLWRNECLA